MHVSTLDGVYIGVFNMLIRPSYIQEATTRIFGAFFFKQQLHTFFEQG